MKTLEIVMFFIIMVAGVNVSVKTQLLKQLSHSARTSLFCKCLIIYRVIKKKLNILKHFGKNWCARGGGNLHKLQTIN